MDKESYVHGVSLHPTNASAFVFGPAKTGQIMLVILRIEDSISGDFSTRL